MSGKKMATIIIGIIIVASLAAAFSVWNFFRTHDTKDSQKVESSAAVIEQSVYNI